MNDKRYLSEKDIDYLEQRLKDLFLTKDEFIEFKNDFYKLTDKVIGELEKIRQEMEITNHHSTGHEDRITSLEKIHPQGQHVAL